MSVTRDNLERSVPFTVTRAEEDSDGLTLEGYAAVFESPTRIDSWEGSFDESIRKGAFRKSLRERTPVIQFDHGHHPLIGSIPIGRFTSISEDDHGLAVTARLSDNWLIEPVRTAIADGAVDGMSFRFSVVREEWRDVDGKLVKSDELMNLLWDAGDRGPLSRTLTEVKVLEAGPVVFPAYADTTVGVRARALASTITGDEELRRAVRHSLATQDRPAPPREDLADPEVRRQVAAALLAAPYDTAGAPPPGHPPAPAPTDRTTDGTPVSDHLPEDPDAPPPDGHPTGTETLSRLNPARLRRDAEQRAGYLALIEKRSERYER